MLRLLAQAEYPEVRLLSRTPERLTASLPVQSGWRVVRGELAQPDSWRGELRGVDTVIHLAASTGKARRKLHFEVNLEGTRRLLEAAEACGVRRFLHVSSIAVTYPDRPHYHYAEAKAAAEALFGPGRLDWLIVRPTPVLGPGSSMLASLRRLALLPVPLAFGTGRVQAQPIHVEDLARLLVGALAVEPWGGRTISAGGPETATIEELLALIRSNSKHAGSRFRHIPLGPTRLLLGLLEPILLPVLPFTAGQLAFFANSSLAEPDSFQARLPAPRFGLAAMLGAAGDE